MNIRVEEVRQIINKFHQRGWGVNETETAISAITIFFYSSHLKLNARRSREHIARVLAKSKQRDWVINFKKEKCSHYKWMSP